MEKKEDFDVEDDVGVLAAEEAGGCLGRRIPGSMR